MCCVSFLLRIVDKLVSLDNKKANLTVNIFPPDHNRTITQISNIIFLLAQTLYLLPELPSVVKCPQKIFLGEIFVKRYIALIHLPAILQDFLFTFVTEHSTDGYAGLIFLLSLFFLSVDFSYDNFVFVIPLKSFSFSAPKSSRLSFFLSTDSEIIPPETILQVY